MRRSLSLLVMLVAGAAIPATAQARARVGARLDPHVSGPPDLLVHVSDLLNDPRWRDALSNAYPLHLHWSVVLWQSRWPIDRPLKPTEWDDVIQQVPVIDVFTFEERTASTTHTATFHTVDSLAAWVGQDARLLTPVNLSAGRWYYTVELSIAAEPPSNQHGADDDPSALSQLVQRAILGGGPREDLPRAKTVTFTVPGS